MIRTTGKRKRARKACTTCRQRKRKCDGSQPCSMCHTYEYSCSYHEVQETIPQEVPVLPVTVPPEPPMTVAGDCSGVTNEHTTSYSRPSAMVAFPRVLSTSLGAEGPSESGSVAFNFGLRPEITQPRFPHLSTIITGQELRQLCAVYFSTIVVIGEFIDGEVFSERCQDYYRKLATTNDNAFGAVIAGVASLGSFFSAPKHEREVELVQYAKNILEDPISMRQLDIDHVTAWALRALYLRSAARADNAWITSCTLLHLCEAVGLHDENVIDRLAHSKNRGSTAGHKADCLRRLFWIAWAGHNILAYEYDRSPVCLRVITCGPLAPVPASVTEQFVRIAHVIPGSLYPNSQETMSELDVSNDLCTRIKTLDAIKVDHRYLINTKADIAFCFYRRLHNMKACVPESILRIVIDIGNAVVGSVTQMATQGTLLWNAIGGVFHYICVLLAMDMPAATAKLGDAFKGLETVVSVADTRLTQEALAMARHLLALRTERKRKELAELEAVERGFLNEAEQPESPEVQENMIPASELDWEVDWGQFITEPYLWMLNPE